MNPSTSLRVAQDVVFNIAAAMLKNHVNPALVLSGAEGYILSNEISNK